jgi:hypothetical protein
MAVSVTEALAAVFALQTVPQLIKPHGLLVT